MMFYTSLLENDKCKMKNVLCYDISRQVSHFFAEVIWKIFYENLFLLMSNLCIFRVLIS